MESQPMSPSKQVEVFIDKYDPAIARQLRGARAKLHDPDNLLKGAGSKIRHIVLKSPGDLELPAVKKLIAQTLEQYEFSFAEVPKRSTLIKMALAKQRSRRPRR
jgi:hypothetical protein